MRNHTLKVLVALSLLFSPALALAQTTAPPLSLGSTLPSNGGIFTCNQTGAYAMSVGALGATGGTYVPVYDNSVTLNTGYLVYKECVLRPVIDAQSHYISSYLTQQELTQFLTGNNNNAAFTGSGNPYFVQNFGKEALNVANSAFNGGFSNVTNNLNAAFKAQIQSALARNYAMTTNNPSASLACPYSNINSVYNNTSFSWAGIFALGNPSCDPVFAYNMAQDQLNANVAAAQNAWLTQLNWGNGIYPSISSSGQVVTPGILVGKLAAQALLSGQVTAQNANDIGQMVSGAVATLASQILNSSTNGLAGINTPLANGQPSYLAQATAASGQLLGQGVGSLAISLITGIYNTESQYYQTQTSMAGTITQAINTLQSQENSCWTYIVQDVCPSGVHENGNGIGSCTDTAGNTISHIATSSLVDFAQNAINNSSPSIPQLASTVAQNASTSAATLAGLQALATAAQSSDPGTQQTALEQVQAISNAYDSNKATNASTDATNVQNFLIGSNGQNGFVQTTEYAWFGNTGATDSNGNTIYQAWDGNVNDPAGWCNVPQSTSTTPTANQQTTMNEWMTIWQ